MKFKLLTLAMASVISFSSVATTIDYRHEMLDSGSNDHKDRLLFSNRFANGFGLFLAFLWKANGGNTARTTPQTNLFTNRSVMVPKW